MVELSVRGYPLCAEVVDGGVLWAEARFSYVHDELRLIHRVMFAGDDSGGIHWWFREYGYSLTDHWFGFYRMFSVDIRPFMCSVVRLLTLAAR